MIETNIVQPLNGSQIGVELGISRQAVSYSIRKSMMKMYKEIIKKGWADPNSPFDVVLVLMEVLGVDGGNTDDVADFVKLLDKKTQKAVREDAVSKYNV